MAERVERTCQVCGSSVGFSRSNDGFFYCGYCNSQADDIFDTGIDDEQIFSHYTASQKRVRTTNDIPAENISVVKLTSSQLLDNPYMEDTECDGVGPTEPSDFGSAPKEYTYEEYYSEIRSRYWTGIQIMIQLQSQALVEKFNVSQRIIGLVGPLWFRFVASTRISADDWADQVVHDSESQAPGVAEEIQPSNKYGNEPVTIHGKRLIYVWHRSLRSTLPVSCSLAISFLVCHLAREPILPSEMLKWTVEGKLPYFAAYVEIEKQLGPHTGACPIRVSLMFRPIQVISSQKLEAMAADIAQKIGLTLPPVNFYALASLYFRQLSLPIGELLPLSCRICEWSTPPGLYLSPNESRFPTRVCVMSILIVAIRILFDINGYGMWESSLSDTRCSSSGVGNEDNESQSHLNTAENGDEDLSSPNSRFFYSNSDSLGSRSSVVKLLKSLEAKYYELNDVPAYSRDLPSYLQYCKDVVFSGLHPPNMDVEEKLLEELWEFYQNNKGTETSDKKERCRDEGTKKRDDKDAGSIDEDEHCIREKAIKKLKLDMVEHQFKYIPPRVKVKNRDYVHYARRRKDVYVYAVHADYYIILRCCAKLAQVETRIMHIAVLTFERRLHWLEKKIDYLLHFKPNLTDDICQLCKDEDHLLHSNTPV